MEKPKLLISLFVTFLYIGIWSSLVYLLFDKLFKVFGMFITISISISLVFILTAVYIYIMITIILKIPRTKTCLRAMLICIIFVIGTIQYFMMTIKFGYTLLEKYYNRENEHYVLFFGVLILILMLGLYASVIITFMCHQLNKNKKY